MANKEANALHKIYLFKKMWFPIATLNNQTVNSKAGRNKYHEYHLHDQL